MTITSFPIPTTTAQASAYSATFDTVTDFLSSTALARGTGVTWNVSGSEGVYSYTEAASGATDHHVVNDAGVKFYVNLNKYDLKAEAWGVKSDGDDADAPANSAALDAMCRYLEAEGQGGAITFAGEGDVRLNIPPDLTNNVTMYGRGTKLTNILTEKAGGVSFTDNVLLLGGLATQDDAQYTFYAADAITLGDQAFTPSVDATPYAVGDIVWIVEAGVDFGLGNNDRDVITYSQFAKITKIDSGICYIDQPIKVSLAAGTGTVGVDAAGAWVAPAGIRTAIERPGGQPGRIFMLEDFAMYDFRLEAKSGAIMQRQGIYGGRFERIRSRANFGFIYGNGFAHCVFNDISSEFNRRGVEFKGRSQDSTGTDIRLYKNTEINNPDTEDPIVTHGEYNRDCHLDISVLNAGGHPDQYFTIADAENCGFGVGVVIGEDCTEALFTLSQYSTGCYFRRAGAGKIDVADAAVGIKMEGENGSVSGLDFSSVTFSGAAVRVESTASGGEIVDNHLNGSMTLVSGASGVQIARNRGLTAWTESEEGNHLIHSNIDTRTGQALQLIGVDYTDVATQSTSLVELIRREAAGQTFRAGDAFHFDMAGTCTTATDTKSLQFTIEGVTTETITPQDLASGTTAWELRFAFYPTSAAAGKYSWQLVEDGVGTDGGSGTASGINAATTFRLQGSVTDATDTLTYTSGSSRFARRGYAT